MARIREQAEATLRETSADHLLDALIRLTHCIHSVGMREGGTSRAREVREVVIRDYRAQRDLIRAEVLRRTGDA